ncbi:flagellar hook-associated protein FlgK [Gracilibacillus boraciitolerans JCM 21714]|uniref:Flagellar hook-associated protein 1 n=1 Tax=Gracilibacillus boraciitolerans JCM 21714 TaxID=1298598 RepID=W4VQL5_9BACI|nr:flagellar hook-associated protein FlgK [Gracilibacillus boraciitolerans]GAE95064.1 flagellar hook-associated protein FlgK [Gracilibacillus boraciitolerans JCM 21714]
MSSTFSGLEVAKRALHTQQAALYTTGHNIANANTEGYTRQRVNMSPTSPPYPPASRNRPEIPGQVGSGVEAGSIERIRDSFIDKQFRQENTKVGFYETKADMMSKMEAILNEPSEAGLSEIMDQFWKSLQDLSVHPEDSGARSVVKERGIAVANAFNYINDSLQQVRSNLKNEIGVDNKAVNSLIDQINQLNGQIAKIEPHGYVANDLYDERDRLVDQLSEYVDINVDYRESSGQPSPIAQGIATISLHSTDHKGDPILLVNGKKDAPPAPGSLQAVNHVFVDFDDTGNVKALFFAEPDPNKTAEQQSVDLVGTITDNNNGTTNDTTNDAAFIYADEFQLQGKLKSLVEGTGYLEGFQYDDGSGTVGTPGTPAGEFNVMLNKLDQMVQNFVMEFNAVHQQGYDLNNDTGVNFFDPAGTTASTIAVDAAIISDTDKIAASTNEDTDGDGTADNTGSSGNGENATRLANVYTNRVEEFVTYNDADLTNDPTIDEKSSIKGYFESIIGEMGVNAQESMRMQNNSQILRQQVEESRQAISSVSLDEEMTNMIQFQHAYNAAARNMTAVDEMLDRIINNMGLVGR